MSLFGPPIRRFGAVPRRLLDAKFQNCTSHRARCPGTFSLPVVSPLDIKPICRLLRVDAGAIGRGRWSIVESHAEREPAALRLGDAHSGPRGFTLPVRECWGRSGPLRTLRTLRSLRSLGIGQPDAQGGPRVLRRLSRHSGPPGPPGPSVPRWGPGIRREAGQHRF